MKRRLALAILLSVWVMLLIGGVVVYVGVRSLLVQELDTLLYARVCALPELNQPGDFDPAQVPAYDWRDHYTIRRQPSASAPAVTTGTPTAPIAPTAPTTPTAPRAAPALVDARFTRDSEGVRHRTIAVAAVAPRFEGAARVPVIVEYSGSSQRVDRVLDRLRLYLAGFGLLVALVAAGVAVWMTSIVLRPLKSTASLLRAIDEESLETRLSRERLPPELLPVSDSLNEMLARLQRAFEGHRRFVTNISYELATPVTTLASLLDGAERKSRTARQDHELIERCNAEVQQLRLLVTRLAECSPLAPADAEPAQAVDVVRLVDECADLATAVAALKKVTLRRSGPEALACKLPPRRVRSILGHLLGNAVELAAAGAEIELGFFHDGERLHLRVGGDGPTFALERLPHLFTSIGEGAGEASDAAGTSRPGLALFIVQSHVRAMGGSCRVETGGSGQETALVVELPCPVVLPEGLMEPSPAAATAVSMPQAARRS